MVPHQQLVENNELPYQNKPLPPPDLELKTPGRCEHFQGTKGCHASWDSPRAPPLASK